MYEFKDLMVLRTREIFLFKLKLVCYHYITINGLRRSEKTDKVARIWQIAENVLVRILIST